jgi:hypothetical protein
MGDAEVTTFQTTYHADETLIEKRNAQQRAMTPLASAVAEFLFTLVMISVGLVFSTTEFRRPNSSAEIQPTANRLFLTRRDYRRQIARNFLFGG